MLPGGYEEPEGGRQRGTWLEVPMITMQDTDEQPAPDRADLVRALRELEAAKARVERTAHQVTEEAKAKLVTDLFPVLDNLDRTLVAAKTRHEAPALIEGVRLVRAQLEHVLDGYGVERIEATGARFDPALHEAISVMPVRDVALHGKVLEQLEPGYRFGERMLRPAKVVVGRAVV